MTTVNVEVVLKPKSRASQESVIKIVKFYLETTRDVWGKPKISHFNKDLHPILHEAVEAIFIEGLSELNTEIVNFSTLNVNFFSYILNTDGPLAEVEECGDEEPLSVATHLTLPSADIHNLWENLYYENDVKNNLLQYAYTMMEFSKGQVDCNVISCNRVILLHGPPGTGKTSLCKALAQKLTIRMQSHFDSGVLIEINSHSLFSKWFSESGKLVTKMFSKIKEVVENPRLLVCLLIDEVESLAHARNQCLSGNEPSDSIRVVNAVLTQLDQIKRYPNVLIFTTSNITESIDLAFIDRADIKQYLGLPSVAAIYQIYYSCLQELRKAKILGECETMVAPVGDVMENHGAGADVSTSRLLKICEKSVGLSGRSLRKIPFLAHALFLGNKLTQWGIRYNLDEFLEAMGKAIDREKAERSYFNNSSLP